jgi:hypothetical protein
LPRVALRRVCGTRQRNLCRVYFCAESPALGNDDICREQDFTEFDTRQRLLCRVPDKKQSAKRRALDKDPDSDSAYSKKKVNYMIRNNTNHKRSWDDSGVRTTEIGAIATLFGCDGSSTTMACNT